MKNIRFILFTLMMAAFAFECKKDSGPSDPGSTGGPLTEQEKQAMIQTYQNIAATADTILLGENPIAGWQSMLVTYRAASNVENAWVTDDALYVKFKKSGTVSWYVAPGVTIPPYGRLTTIIPKAKIQTVGALSNSSNMNVCLFNQLDSDESRSSYAGIFSSLKSAFEASGFTVTTKNGAQGDVNFFKAGLKQFGVIFLLAHGEYDAAGGSITWVNTGEELVGTDAQNLAQLLVSFESDFNAQRISIGVYPETRGGQKRAVSSYKISNRFIEANYAANDFPNSMIYLCNCQSMKDPNREMAKTFERKGAGAVIGWTEKHEIGPHTGKLLLDLLLCGKNLLGAITALPAESKTDRSAGPRAELLFSPSAASNFRIVEERRVTLNLTRPQKDSTYTTRNLQLAASIIEGDSILNGIVELNGLATDLSILSDHKSFSQPIVLKSGTNSIRLTGCVKLRDGRFAAFDSAYSFTGNFELLDLWTHLRWNTKNSDVDFHLLRPGANFPGDFWTSSDCYYGNRATSWGAFLDVDDVDGIGPEQITIPRVTVDGEYRLFVHYYASHGAGATAAFITVSVRNGPYEKFNSLSLSRSASRGGDVWEVCTITYPAGTVTRVMRKTTLPGLDQGTSLVRSAKK